MFNVLSQFKQEEGNPYHTTKVLVCETFHSKSITVAAGVPLDPCRNKIPRQPWLPFVLPTLFDVRLRRRLGSAECARGPARPHWICCVMVFGRKACFSNDLNDFWVTVSADRPLPRGAPGKPFGMYWFYKRFQHCGRALRGASHGPAICCAFVENTKRL